MTPTSPPPRDRRIVVVDDHLLLAESLASSLRDAGYDAVPLRLPASPRGDGDWLLGAITRLRPALVLLDPDLGPHGDARRVILPLARRGVPVVVLTGSARSAAWGECLALGSRTVLAKTAPLGEVRSAVRRVLSGTPVLPRADRERLVAAWRAQEEESATARRALTTLSASESAVLALLREGRTVAEISRQRSVAVHTVRSQVKSILHKLQVSSQVAAVGLANQVLGPRTG